MTSNPTTGVHSGAISQERSPKVTDLRAPSFGAERASSLLGLAKGAVRRGEHRLAARLFARALEKDPNNLDGTLGLAAAELMLGNGDATEQHAFRALEIAPDSPDARLVLANLRIAQDRHQEAIQLLRDSITVDPEYAQGLSRLGTILTALGEHAAAKPILLRALALDPADADALNSIGNVVLNLGDAEGAALHFERAVAASPGWIKPRQNLAVALEQLGRLDEAMDALDGALAQDPSHQEAKVYLAGLLHRTGNLARALQFLDDVTEADPDHLGAQFLTGLIKMQDDRPADAVAPLEKAYSLAPGSNDIRVNLACAYRGTERTDEALVLAEAAVKADPEDVLALNTLGSVLLDQRRENEAIDFFQRAVDRAPQFNVGLVNLATALMACDRPKEAIPHLEHAMRYGAEPQLVLRKLGLAFRDAGDLAKAESYLRQAVEADPSNSGSLYTLSSILETTGRVAEIAPIADRILASDSEAVHAYVTKALSLGVEDGLATIAKALAIEPDNVDALLVAGTLNDSAGRPDESLKYYERVLSLVPDHKKALARRTDILLSLCDWEKRDELVADVHHALEDCATPTGFDVFNLQAIDLGYDQIAAAAKAASTAIVQKLEKDYGELWVPRVANNSERIRIGYLLPYTWFHSLPMVLRRIVQAHDRERFEVVGFATNVNLRKDPFEKAYQAAFDEFHSLVGMTPKQAARKVGAEGIDILVEVSGHTSISCLPVAAFRPAPVQVHMLGYSITTGAPFIDYLITDETYVPRDQAAMGSEKPVYMPNSFMPALRQPIAAAPISRVQLGLPRDAFVLANFNHPCKFEPKAFAAWMDILNRVPNAVLWLGHWFDATKQNLWRNAESHGVARERLIFAEIAEHADHLRRLSQADLALDNLLHGGGITTIDALWAGLPVLSMRGETPSSRLGATLLNAVDMNDLVVESLDAYVDQAVALAQDKDRIESVRKRLEVNRETGSLFDLPRYVKDLERGYEAIWQVHRAGQAPQPIDLKD